jgi:type II secretory pathway pseudopilin PulG
MTLVETLIVTAIIAMLISLLLPAINAARESGRRVQCLNNIRQLAAGAISHQTTHGTFPSGGWGDLWAPIPGRFGVRQPGSWLWPLLPFLERTDLVETGFGATSRQQESQMAIILQTPMSNMNCPSRRGARAYPIVTDDYAKFPNGSAPVRQIARSDYAMNAGDRIADWITGWQEPPTLAHGDDPKFPWPIFDHSGVSYLRSQVTVAHMQARDGTGRTYLIAEKSLVARAYGNGQDRGDHFSMYNGYHLGMHRFTAHSPLTDTDQVVNPYTFGSVHAGSWNASFADGSARPLSYGIDPAIHRAFGNLRDGAALGDDLIR